MSAFAGINPKYTASSTYNPRLDPAFIDRCIVDLVASWVTNPGVYRPLGRLYAPEVLKFERCCMVREAVDWARKLGWQVEGNHQGYRIVGFKHPKRLYTVRPGRRSGDGRDERKTPIVEV